MQPVEPSAQSGKNAATAESEAPTAHRASRPERRVWWRWLQLTLIAALLVAAAGALGLALIDSGRLHELILKAGRDPEDSMFTEAAIAGIQQRALWAAIGYILLAVITALTWRRVLGLPRQAMTALPPPEGGPGRHALDWTLVALMTAIALALASAHIGQTMRLDEVSTFFNFGLRSPLATLALYHNVNNHILHSLLMLGSINIFGEAEWAIRLPAMLAAVASVPMMYIVGRLHFNRATGLIAAGAMAGSIYLVELATNARGYSLVNLAALIAFAATPAMLRSRPWAWAAFVFASALGAWATPTMLYPFAAATIWLGLAGLDGRWPMRQRLHWWRDVAIAVAATGALVLILYSPALVVTGFGDMGTTRVAQSAARISEGQRSAQILQQLVMAWEQWTYPAPPVAALATALLAALGWILALRRGGPARWLAIGAAAGPAAVVLVMGGITPWWWSLGYLFLFYVLLSAAALGAVVVWLNRERRNWWLAPAGGAAAVSISAVIAIASDFEDDFPHYHGYRDAPLAAALIAQTDIDGVHFAGTSMTRIPIEYYLYRSGFPERALDPLRGDVDPDALYTVVRQGRDDPDPAFDGMMLTRAHHLPRSTLLLYHRSQPPRTTSSQPGAAQPPAEATSTR